MGKFILGTKTGMTSMFDDSGKMIPVTVVHVAPNIVVQVKTKEHDGYEALQIGTGERRKLSKSLRGHFKNLGNFRYVHEYRGTDINGQALKAGDHIGLDMFAPGEKVKVSGISKGKGFAGGVKRYGFAGMPASHGHHHVLRHIGSIGQRFPQHTLKGKKMAGRMGGDRISVRGLRIMAVDPEHQLLAVQGSVPGNRGSLLAIYGL